MIQNSTWGGETESATTVARARNAKNCTCGLLNLIVQKTGRKTKRHAAAPTYVRRAGRAINGRPRGAMIANSLTNQDRGRRPERFDMANRGLFVTMRKSFVNKTNKTKYLQGDANTSQQQEASLERLSIC